MSLYTDPQSHKIRSVLERLISFWPRYSIFINGKAYYTISRFVNNKYFQFFFKFFSVR